MLPKTMRAKTKKIRTVKLADMNGAGTRSVPANLSSRRTLKILFYMDKPQTIHPRIRPVTDCRARSSGRKIKLR
jgi:hypothetical protein